MESGTLRSSSFSSRSLLSGARQQAMMGEEDTDTCERGPDLSSAHSTIGAMHRDGENHHRITMYDTGKCPAVAGQQRAQRRKKPCMLGLQKALYKSHSDLKLQLSRAAEARALPDDTCSGLCSLHFPPPFHFLTENRFNSGCLLLASIVLVLWETFKSTEANWHLLFPSHVTLLVGTMA